jgi:hypothetical protein
MPTPATPPPPSEGAFTRLRRAVGALRGNHAAIFTRIHRHNVWNEPETPSGPGSTEARAADFRAELIALLARLGTSVLLDAPCGDGNWIGPVAAAVPRYLGVDVVPELVAACRARNAAPGREFLLADLTRDRLPPADVVLCRDCLVHFSDHDVRTALANLRRSGARWLLTTSFVEHADNPPIRTGGWRPLNLERPPFSLPRPVEVVDERCTHSGGRYRDKRLALWPMEALPG